MSEQLKDVSSLSDQFELKNYFNSFRNSPDYQEASSKFFEGKVLAEDVTEEEKKEVFERSESTKLVMISFAEKGNSLVYNPRNHSFDTQESVQNYLNHVRDFKLRVRKGATPEEIQNLDTQRTQFHNRLATNFIEKGYAPNLRMGRALGRLILVTEGIETLQEARVPDIEKARRTLR